MRHNKRFATRILTVALAAMVTFTALPMESYAATMNYHAWLESARTMAQRIEKAKFKFDRYGCPKGTFSKAKKLKGSKKVCNCADFISWSMQNAGLLKTGKRFYVKQKSVYGGGAKTIKGKNFQIIKISGRPRAATLAKKGILKPGDLVSQADGSGHHMQLYAGKNSKGQCVWYAVGKKYQVVNGTLNASRILSTQKDHRAHHNNPQVAMIIRIKGLSYQDNFKLKASATNGKITSTGSVKWRGKKKFTYSANTGYKLSKVLVDGKSVSTSKYGKSYTFSNVTMDHTIQAVFERIEYKVNTTLEHCTISSDRTAAGKPVAYYDLNTKITITPEDGYRIDRVLLNGKEITLADDQNSIVISKATANQDLKIYCVLDESVETGESDETAVESDNTAQTADNQGEAGQNSADQTGVDGDAANSASSANQTASDENGANNANSADQTASDANSANGANGADQTGADKNSANVANGADQTGAGSDSAGK